MFSKTLKFKDFNEVDQEKTFWFHLSKTEIAALSHGADALQERMRRIERAKDGLAIMREFTEIIKLAVGERTADGQRFLKSAEVQSELLDSPALDALLLELLEGNAMIEFISALVPDSVQKELAKEFQAKLGSGAPDPFKEPEDPRPKYQIENREPTSAEMQRMSRSELQDLFRWKEARKDA